MKTPSMDGLDRQLLDAIQRGIPLHRNPWCVLGEPHHMPSREVLRRIACLKEGGIVRHIGPIYDSAALGYTSTLVAARVPEDRIDAAASVVSRHPGVSHNYRREAAFNLWFTLAVPPGDDLAVHLAQLQHEAGLEDVLALPAERTFHIGVHLPMTDAVDGAPPPSTGTGVPEGRHRAPRQPVSLSSRDRVIIRVTQKDLPLVDHPFDGMCDTLRMNFAQLAAWLEGMQTAGALRRFAAILNHRSAGFGANAMVVWCVPEDRVEEAGRLAARIDQVSHCYQRTAYERWPFNLYTMVHDRTRAQCDEVVHRILTGLRHLGLREHRALYSTVEYKKARIRYFVPSAALETV